MSPASQRYSPHDIPAETFRQMGYELVDQLADFLAKLRDKPVAPADTPRSIRTLIEGDLALPLEGADPGAILAEATRLMLSHSTLNGHPRFFGYITSSAAPLGALADLLAAAVNPNVGAWALSPVATEIERQTVRWIAELLGFPNNCGGLLVSGGNMANAVCAFAALRAQAPWSLREKGMTGDGSSPLALYGSSETHTWLDKFADLSGLGTDAIRRVAMDDEGRIRPSALRIAIEADQRAGVRPCMVIGTAGTVSTGVVDPLREINSICKELGVWFHVDGAYGAPAAALADASDDLRALSWADSLAVDPHKWMYAPLEAGCVLVREAANLHKAFSHHPPYYRFDGDTDDPPLNYYEWGPQNSRGFRALKVWLGLRHAGREGVQRMISDDIDLARSLYEHVKSHPELEPLTTNLSITTFRYVPADLRADRGSPDVGKYIDELNERLLAQLQIGGEVYLSNAIVGGRFALRACIVNFRTTERDIGAVPAIVAKEGKAIDVRIRPAGIAGL
ncbi:MAG: aminotransferase class V-fold PLP-dependent enzyme [Anaerolineae bacterium]|nr:aminotransferase class V-fold PLP-dependent enzyme [Gemmatimonadaceae bacterium]